MLNTDTRMEILGITVYQDADRTNQFYYLPGPPHISRESGELLFDLFSYRKGGEAGSAVAGGFLNVTVDVGIGDLKDRIESQLRQQYGDDVTLASVPFTKGSVRVIALGEDTQAVSAAAASETTPGGDPVVAKGPRFIQNILGAGTPSLDGDNRSIFSLSLTEDGAAFFLAVLSGAPSARPVGVIYDLSYVGLLPAYDLEITIDFKSVYNYMQTRFNLATLFFKADVDNIVEELKRSQTIVIKETARTLDLSKPEAVRERQNRIDQLVKDLATGALFAPALTPGEPRVKDAGLTADDPTKAVPGESPTMAALRLGPTVGVAAGMSAAMGRAADPEKPVPGSQSSQPGGGGTTTTGDGGIQSAGDLWNKLGRPQAAFTFKSIRQEEQRTVSYKLTQVTAQEQHVAPQGFISLMADTYELNQRVHVIDLNNPFFQRLNINVNARDVDFDAQGIVQMTVQLRYGTRPDGTAPKDTAEAILRSKDDGKDFTFFTDARLTQWYEYKLILDYKAGFGIGVKDPRVEGPWTRTEARSLTVQPSWLEHVLPVTVQLAPNVPDDLVEAQVRLRYANPAAGVDDSTLLHLSLTDRQKLVPIRLVDPGDSYRADVTLFYKDGTSETLAPLTLPDPGSGLPGNVVMVAVAPDSRLSGDVIMQDPLGEIDEVLVDTQVQQGANLLASHTYEMTNAARRQTFSLRLVQPNPRPVLTYRERRMYHDGGLEDLAWQEAQSPNLVVGIPAARVLNVTVRYIGPALTGLGVSALQLDLSYRDPKGDARFDQSASLIITDDAPGSKTQQWKIRLPDIEARDYQWTLTALMSDGSQVVSPARTDTREQLILRVPQL